MEGGKNMNTQTYDKYRIECEDKHDKFYVKVYNTNAKAYNSLKKYYQFRTEGARNIWVDNFKDNVARHNEAKARRKAERMAFKNPAKVGDILYSSWGYDQTNVDFYQVTKVTKKMIYFMPISGTYTNDSLTRVKPVRDSFKDKEEVRKGLVKGSNSDSYYVNLNSYSWASLTDENKDHYVTDPYSGH